jgi:hypothetical protein
MNQKSYTIERTMILETEIIATSEEDALNKAAKLDSDNFEVLDYYDIVTDEELIVEKNNDMED